MKTIKATDIMPEDVHPIFGPVIEIRIRNNGRSIDIYFDELKTRDGRRIPMFCTLNTRLEMAGE